MPLSNRRDDHHRQTAQLSRARRTAILHADAEFHTLQHLPDGYRHTTSRPGQAGSSLYQVVHQSLQPIRRVDHPGLHGHAELELDPALGRCRLSGRQSILDQT